MVKTPDTQPSSPLTRTLHNSTILPLPGYTGLLGLGEDGWKSSGRPFVRAALHLSRSSSEAAARGADGAGAYLSYFFLNLHIYINKIHIYIYVCTCRFVCSCVFNHVY